MHCAVLCLSHVVKAAACRLIIVEWLWRKSVSRTLTTTDIHCIVSASVLAGSVVATGARTT